MSRCLCDVVLSEKERERRGRERERENALPCKDAMAVLVGWVVTGIVARVRVLVVLLVLLLMWLLRVLQVSV